MPSLSELRARLPQLQGFDDQDAISFIQQAYYPGRSADEVGAALGVQPPGPAAEKSGITRRLVGDTGVSLLKGAISVPEAAVGVADLVTGGAAGRAAESIGFRPREAREELDQWYSPEQQAANREVQQAEGFWGTAAAAARNPSTIAHAVVESAPSLLPAGAIARGARVLAPGLGGAAAVGIGEGVVSAGQTAEQVRQQTDDGLLTGEQSALAAASGGLTGVIGGVAGKIANRLGIGDVNQLVAGVQEAGPRAQQSFARALLQGFATEGVLQELPQSAQEQIAQNVALGKPWDEGVGNAAAMGALSGGLLGAGVAPLGRRPSADESMQKLASATDVGGMIAAANELASAPLNVPASVGLDAEQENRALTAMERQMASDQQAIRLGGPRDAGPGSPVPIPRSQESAPVEASAEIVPDAPLLDRLETLNEQLRTPEVRETVRATLGDEALGSVMYYVQRANRPDGTDGIPASTRERIVSLAETILSRALLQPMRPQGRAPGIAPQPFGTEALTGTPAPTAPRVGLDTRATGTLRVDADGVAVPETRADAINTAQMQRAAAGQAAEAEAARSGIEPQARRASAVYGEGLPKRPAPPVNMPERRRTDAVELQPVQPENADPVLAYVDRLRSVATPAARAFVQDFNAGRITRRDVVRVMQSEGQDPLTADERLQQAAALAPASRGTGLQIAAPYRSRTAASVQARKTGGDVVPVEGGFTVEMRNAGSNTGGDGAGGATDLGTGGDAGMVAGSAGRAGAGGAVRRSDAAGLAVGDDGRGQPDALNAVDAAAQAAATSAANELPEPTQAQKEAGNYKLGHTRIAGLDISIENPQGSTRSGVDRDGKAWENNLQHHYGYIKRTEGKDGEHVDVFVKPGTVPDFAGKVFVIDQVDPATGRFDEHKAMIGFATEAEARKAYRANYAKGWTGLKAMTPMSVDEFKAWVRDEARTKRPASREAQAPAKRKRAAGLDPERDTLLQAVTKMGGLSRDAVAREFGLKPEELKSTVQVGNLKGYPFRKTGGMSIDGAIEQLREAGYFDGVQDDELRSTLEEAVFGELGGSPRLSTRGQMRRAEDLGREQAEQQPAEELTPAEEAEREALLDRYDVPAAGIDQIDDDAIPGFDDNFQTDPKALAAFLGETYDEAIHDQQAQQDAQGRPAARGAAQDRGDAAGRPQAPTGAGSEATRDLPSDEGLTLTSQTSEELLARAERVSQAQAADVAEQKRLADKAKADAERDEFTLTGSDSAADVAAAGQGGLFDAPAPVPTPLAAPSPADAPSPLQAYKDTVKAIYAGTASVDVYRAAYRRVRDESSIRADLQKLTKDELIRTFGIMRDGKKDELVAIAYESMLRDFALGKDYGPKSYFMTRDGLENFKKLKAAALDELVQAQTEEDLAAFAAEVAKNREERVARRAAQVESIQNPKTLDDFRRFMEYHTRDGKTTTEVRLTQLTPEQRAQFDTLLAEESRGKRKATTQEQRTVRVAGQTVDGEIIATKHTKKGHDVYVVRLAERVSREDYDTLNAGAKRIGGYYSSFRGAGAIPGFQFTSREQAEAFLTLANGDNTAAQAAAQERRDAFEDDRSQSAVERLEEMAERLEDQANESLGRERKANTARRARFAASAEASANSDKALARTMRNIAGAIARGSASMLDRVRQKVQVEYLRDTVLRANDEMVRARSGSYSEYERNRGAAPTQETADFATFPEYTAMRSDLASLARQLLEVDGTKAMGQRIMKVADDVSEAFEKWAKEPVNFARLSTFTTRDGTRPGFTTKDLAERAIARSGYKGKAIPWTVKRGEHTIIMSPSEAMSRGLWQGDGDKRITLDRAFGAELVEKIGRANRRGARVSVPWAFEAAYDRQKMLARMGIETPAEFRTALREFITLQERPEAPSRVKELERKLIGRRNDGFDFFPTPEATADEMVAAADIQAGMRVLEPSAGMGHIADRIRAAGVDPDVVEIESDKRELLEAKGYEVVGRDFLDVSEGGYDRIVMNPPFSDGRDIQHVRHAFDLLKPGGRLVAIMGESAFTNQNKRATEFRAWLEEIGGTDEKLGQGTFMDPSLPVNTGANARMVVIEKADVADEASPKASRKADPERAAQRWTRTDRNAAGPEFYGRDVDLIALREFDLTDEFSEDALPLGHTAQVRDGNTAHKFLITDHDGGVLGEASLEVSPAGEIEAIHDIEMLDKRTGAGRQAIAAILANASGPVRIIDILDQSDAFWQKMGAGYKDTYGNASTDWQSYRAAQGPDARGGQGARQAPGGELEAGRAASRQSEGSEGSGQEVGPKADRGNLFDLLRGSSGVGFPVKLARLYADAYGNGGLQRVNVARNISELPSDLRAKLSGFGDDVRGAYFPDVDQIWVFSDKITSPEELHFVVIHEAFHRGLGRVFGDQGRKILRQMYATNQKLRERADMVAAELRISRDEAIEEALADMAGEGQATKLRGWSRLVSMIRQWLRQLSQRMGVSMKFSDAQIETFVAGVARAGLESDGAVADAVPEAAAASRNADREPEARASRAASMPGMRGVNQQAIRSALADRFKSAGETVGWWQKTVGTQYDKAKAHPAFGRVFNHVQQYIEDTSTLANEAADKAPSILPKLESVRDVFNAAKRGLSKADQTALAAPVFEGTLSWSRQGGKLVKFDDLQAKAENMSTAEKAQQLLRDRHVSEAELKRWQATPLDIYEGAVRNRYEQSYLQAGVVFTRAELQELFKLNDAQVQQYEQFRAAVDESLDQVAAADALRLLGDPTPEIRAAAMGDRASFRAAVEAYLTDRAKNEPDEGKRDQLTRTWNDIADKFKRVDELKARGYAPLMRFGRYSVGVRGADGQQEFFGIYETRAEANRMARELSADPEFAGRVEQGTMSQEQYKLFSGIPVESLEMFADALGAEQSAVFQEWLRLTKNNRSALKRLIKRKGTAGFSEEVSRVLASFVTSNARMAAGAMNLGQAKEAAEEIRAGDLKDEGVKLVEAVQNPVETAGSLRGLMFVHFIGGSIASAVVNTTQPLMMTLPWLSQYGGASKAAARLMASARMAAGGKIADKEMAAALARAEKDGIVSPQEIHHLTAEAMATWGKNPVLKRAAFLWGAPFSVAEQFNRRVTFLAAYQTAKAEGMADPFAFAHEAVVETQGLYNKGNASNWARNPIGATALTFKQYSVHYLEWIKRMWNAGEPGSKERTEGRKAVLFAMALLFAAGGSEGLPFAEDLNDLADTVMQALGFDTSAKGWKREFLARTLGMGDTGADVAMRGLSALPGIPLDVSMRMGMGNLLPGTGMLMKSNTDVSRDVLELAGPVGGMVNQYKDAGRKALEGDMGGAALGMLPVAMQNVGKAASMFMNGEARDTRGRRVMETDELDAVMKLIGFQPADVARTQSRIGEQDRRVKLIRVVESSIADQWAQGLRERDADMVNEAREQLRDWNEANPDSRIAISSSQIKRRLKELQSDKVERFQRAAPRELRESVAEAIQ